MDRDGTLADGRSNAFDVVGANVPNGGGMQNAMTVNNANGNNGMFGAVGATTC